MDSVTKSRPELLQQLRRLGVETVTAEYDGCGDSGQVDDPHFGSDWVARDLRTAVQDLFYDVLEENYGGWELDEGSFGQFTWDVRRDRISLVYNGRKESVHTEERYL